MAYVIKETGGDDPLPVLFRDSGMEIEPSHTPPAGEDVLPGGYQDSLVIHVMNETRGNFRASRFVR